MTSSHDDEPTTISDDRIMNDTTMPPPPPPVSASVTFVGVEGTNHRRGTAAAPPPPPRRKKEGRFGLAAWTRLVASSKDLAQRHGRPLRSDITWDEIRQHNTIHDGWIVLKGKVYFISPYLAYHPGGEAILKPVLGKDATQLYYKYHMWVNEDGSVILLIVAEFRSIHVRQSCLLSHIVLFFFFLFPLFFGGSSLIKSLQIGYLDTTKGRNSDSDEDDEKQSSSYLPKTTMNTHA